MIRQPLVFGDKLTMHVPLCSDHNEVWLRFVEYLKANRKQSARDRKLAEWAIDAALAFATYPPHETR